jgi:hypothetical protein
MHLSLIPAIYIVTLIIIKIQTSLGNMKLLILWTYPKKMLKRKKRSQAATRLVFLAYTAVIEEEIIHDKIKYIYYRISYSYYSLFLMHISKKIIWDSSEHRVL